MLPFPQGFGWHGLIVVVVVVVVVVVIKSSQFVPVYPTLQLQI